MKAKSVKLNIINELVPNIIEICIDNIGLAKTKSIKEGMKQMDDLQEQ